MSAEGRGEHHRRIGFSLRSCGAEQGDRSYGQMTQLVGCYGNAVEEADIVIEDGATPRRNLSRFILGILQGKSRRSGRANSHESSGGGLLEMAAYLAPLGTQA